MDQPQRPAASRLQELSSVTEPDVLEKAVKLGRKFLRNLEKRLQDGASSDPSSDDWIKAVSELRGRAVSTKAIVGVVGNTGAGKSSVINALLDEERLLPTNCMRACTAAPTEISYNSSDNPDELYRAEIEFISLEEWKKEVRLLVADFANGGGGIGGSDEGAVALAKLKAVYPNLDKQRLLQLSKMGQLELTGDLALPAEVGSTMKLQAESAAKLYSAIQSFVDSKEKREAARMEYWPLINVIRIYTKAAALSTGAVLVDLPGVQDSNAARAAVAANYLKNCSAIWVVAPINRAVDDKTAKSLLGDSFKRQLKYDGIYSAVTFICSKTDDIAIEEAVESLSLPDKEFEMWNEVGKLSSEIADREESIEVLKQMRLELDDKSDTASDDEDELNKTPTKRPRLSTPTLSTPTCTRELGAFSSPPEPMGEDRGGGEGPRDGCVKDAPAAPITPRKEPENASPAGTLLPKSGGRDGESFVGSSTESTPVARMGGLLLQTPSRKGETLACTSVDKPELSRIADLDNQIRNLRTEIKKLKAEKKNLLGPITKMCIRGRNSYSRGAIRQDFAGGIRDLDEEARGSDDFDPDTASAIRDYDEVAKSLPVFCVSSHSFQSMRRRMRRGNFNTRGFENLEDTEMPQLQKHAVNLTGDRRASNCRHFLLDLDQLLTSMRMWSDDDGTHSTTIQAKIKEVEESLEAQLLNLDKDFKTAIQVSMASMMSAIQSNIVNTFSQSLPTAVRGAPEIVARWGGSREDGGVFWSTFRATDAMVPAYMLCAEETGLGTYVRMKRIVQERIEVVRRTMFSDAAGAVRTRLDEMLTSVESELKTRLTDIHGRVSRDYRSALIGASGLSPEGLELREDISLLLRGADANFANVVPAHQP